MRLWLTLRWERLRDPNTWALFVADYLPRRVKYWCTILVATHAAQGKWSNQDVPALTVMDALKRWEEK